VIAAASVRALDLIEQGNELREQLHANAARFRAAMSTAGFTLPPGEHPIIPVMLGDATLAARFAERLLEHGVYAIGFSFPVVPQGRARIRTQMCAGHTPEQVDRAVTAFTAVGRELGVIN
jgi:glycine C-acetyltransferase